MSTSIITAPASEPLTVAEVKRHLELHSSDSRYDDDLPGLITGARQHVERVCGLALMPQTWRLALPGFPDDCAPILLPGCPVNAVTSVEYVDGGGTTRTLGSTDLDLSARPAMIAPLDSGWPATARRLRAVIITYTLGYADAAAVPDDIKAALKLIIGDRFRQREGAVIGESYVWTPAVDQLLWPWREMGT